MRQSILKPRALLPIFLWSASQGAAQLLSTAPLLYVASYSGAVTTLNLTASAPGSGFYPVAPAISSSNGCGESPSWLTLDHPNAVLYCINEGLSGSSSLSSLRTNADGSLTSLDLIASAPGPVSGVIYGSKRDGLAMAHYGGSSFSTWNIANPSDLKNVQTFTFKLDGPGADPGRQDAPHPHEAVLDPTGKYLLVPDLGADYIRIFNFNDKSLEATAQKPIKVAPGSGPRHLAFAKKAGKTFAYLITELTSSIVGYEVTYGSTIQFRRLFTIGVHGKGKPNVQGGAAAEIIVSPDNKFLIASSRGENQYTVPNFDSKNSTNTIPSDPLINFSIGDDGSLTVLQDIPAGGRFPRQFSLNKAGTMVAVGLQSDSRVVVFARDPAGGHIGQIIAYADVAGEITNVSFDE